MLLHIRVSAGKRQLNFSVTRHLTDVTNGHVLAREMNAVPISPLCPLIYITAFQSSQMFCNETNTARHLTRFNYILGDKSPQETDNHPYLRVHITKGLTRNKHIHQIIATANHTLAFVRRNLYSAPTYYGRDRFESTASAGRRIPSASPIDLPLAISEDPLTSSAKGDGRG